MKSLRIFAFIVIALFAMAAVRAQVSSPQASATPGADTAQAPAEVGPGQKANPAIRVTTQTVPLTITVADKKHNFITDLSQSDFRVLENGVPQDIRFFSAETDLPLRIAVLIDTSNSIRPRLQFEQDAAIDFLNRVIRPLKDQAFLMTFDNEPQVIQDYTDDIGILSDAIRDQRAGGGTALNDALYMASEKLVNAPLPRGTDKDVRRVVVLISDGNDNLSDRAPSDATEAVIRSGAAVYAISTNTDWITLDQGDAPRKYEFTEGDKILMQFSDQTGGRTFFPYRVEDLGESFVQIGTELRSQYFIAYTPTLPPDGKYHTINVQVDRKGLVVRTRKGYYAKAAEAAATPGH
ncbi:MAG TPA: VWA domain-containing protein [Candidatus Acidoferrales bacterium]|nr:VWA domain-containing protein [Candidatus Acidoferrales bacterium]